MSTKLHEAVHRTANKLLDTPYYIRLTDDPSSLEKRLISVLQPLEYVRINGPHMLDMGYEIHPLAHKYFKRYGEQYVQLLEATQRLTK